MARAPILTAILTAACISIAGCTTSPTGVAEPTGNPTDNPSVTLTPTDTPTNTPTTPAATWITTTAAGRTITIPTDWAPTTVPGGDAAWNLPGGTAAAITFTTPTPATITDRILTETATSISQAAPQLTLATQNAATPTQGHLVFTEGTRTLHVWLVSTPQGIWTVTLGQPYQTDNTPPPQTPPPNPTSKDVAAVEQFIARNTTG